MSDLYPEDELRCLLRHPTGPFGTEEQISRIAISRIHAERKRRWVRLGIFAICANALAALLIAVALLRLAPHFPRLWEDIRPALESAIGWIGESISAMAPAAEACVGHLAPWLIPGFLLLLIVESGGIWILKTHWHRL
jgi:hypothetical protein